MTIPKTINIARHWLSRREFLKHTNAAAIGLTVPAVYGAEPSATPPPLSSVDRFNYVRNFKVVEVGPSRLAGCAG